MTDTTNRTLSTIVVLICIAGAVAGMVMYAANATNQAEAATYRADTANIKTDALEPRVRVLEQAYQRIDVKLDNIAGLLDEQRKASEKGRAP